MAKDAMEPDMEVLAETEEYSYMAWKAEEPDGEVTYHLDLGMVTVHFFKEEWEEFLKLIKALV